MCIYTAAVVIFISSRIAFQEYVLKSNSVFLFEWDHQLVTQTKKNKLTREKQKRILILNSGQAAAFLKQFSIKINTEQAGVCCCNSAMAEAENLLTIGIRYQSQGYHMQGNWNQNLVQQVNRQLHHLYLLHIMDQQLQLGFAKTFVEDANGRQANLTAQLLPLK